MLEKIEHELYKLPTYGQLERELSQKIHRIYREQLGHSPGRITCSFFGNNLAIIIEDALTALEQRLVEENKDRKIVEQLNLDKNYIIKSKLKILIEQVVAVEVCDVLFDSSLQSKQAGVVVILSQLPTVRPQKPIAKVQKNKCVNNHVDGNDSSQA